jgi:hypothetical protein
MMMIIAVMYEYIVDILQKRKKKSGRFRISVSYA